MGGKRIDVFLDTCSYYSYVAFADLIQNKDKLNAQGVQLEFHPVFLGGIINLSGNKPPWMLAAKDKYLKYDSRRAATRVGKGDMRPPPDFVKRAMTISTQRALLYIKNNFPEDVFVSAMHNAFHKFWIRPQANMLDDEELAAVFAGATKTPGDGGAKLFSAEDVSRIMKGRDEMKDALKQETEKAVELGAFGAPWLWATNAQGRNEPFFGSDRFNHLYNFLEIPYQDVTILEPAKL